MVETTFTAPIIYHLFSLRTNDATVQLNIDKVVVCEQRNTYDTII